MFQKGNSLGVVDKRQAPLELQAAPSTADAIATTAVNWADDGAMDTRLAAAAAATYTATVLKGMTDNDKVFALRTLDENAGII